MGIGQLLFFHYLIIRLKFPMTHIREVLAGNLKAYRYILGWSQAKLAEKVNTGTHYIGMIEIGKKFPSPEMIEKIADALGIESHQLFSKTDTPSKSMKLYRKAMLTDINGLLSRFIAGKIQDMDNEIGDCNGKSTAL
jgi:transcriptional regulator with XRE-family HTH domain